MDVKDFIYSLTTEDIAKIRGSISDAEVRRILLEKLSAIKNDVKFD
jgi:hypothetical protein